MIDEDLTEIRKLAMRLLDLTGDQAQTIAQVLNADENRQFGSLFSGIAHSREAMWMAARRELARRSVRRDSLPEDMFSEGGWNILLDLYDHEYRDKPVSIMDAVVASEIPTTTALRHIGLLIERGLAMRHDDPGDNRRCFIRLTRAGELAVRSALAAQLEGERRADAGAEKQLRGEK